MLAGRIFFLRPSIRGLSIEGALKMFLHSRRPPNVEGRLPADRETIDRIRTCQENASTNMASREEFLSAIQNNLLGKLCINYYLTEDTGFSIPSTEIKKITETVHASLVEIIDGGFQFVGIFISDYLWLPCLLLSIWRSGNACACVGTQYADEYNCNFMNNLKVRYLLTDNNEFWAFAETIRVFQINHQKFYLKQRKFHPGVKNSNTNICYGIMTSGTTGVPKIVQVPWSCILPNVYQLISLFSVDKNDNICLMSPYTFDPFFVELFMWMMTGCCLTVISPDLKMCPQTLLKILFKRQDYHFTEKNFEGPDESIVCKTRKIINSLVTVLQMTPSLFKRWSVSCVENCILSSDSSLRILLLGGEKFPENVLRLKSSKNQTKIYNIYGITEISCWAFISKPLENCAEISIGEPLNDILYRIDENHELHIGSRKRKCLVDSETDSDPGEVVFRRTGDLVTLKNGEIYFESRISRSVKKYGIKINLEKIETLFLTVNKHIPDCVCVFDETAMKTAIFYVNNDIKNDYSIITGEKQKTLMNFKDSTTSNAEVPDYVIEVQRIPVNSNGKCEKESLLRILRNVANSKNIGGDIEEKFRDAWTGFVEGDNFVVSGGDSVKALQILTRLEESGIEVPENFLPLLLKDGGYESCLSCLTSGGNRSRPTRKKTKPDDAGEVFAFSLSWVFDTLKCVDAPPAVCENNGTADVIVGSHSSRLSSVKMDNGEENWTINLGGRIESGVCTDKASTFGVVGCHDTYVYCISIAAGEVIWKYKTGGMVKSTPCLSTNEENVYAASYDTFLYCLQSRTGSLIKKIKLGDRGIFSSGVVSDELGALFIATLDGTCVSLCQETNAVEWKETLPNPVFASPVPLGHGPDTFVLFVEVVGRLHCFDAKTGAEVWRYQTDACIYSTPAFASRFVVFGCHDCRLRCLRFSPEPTLQWETDLDSPIFAGPCRFEEGGETFVVAASTRGWMYLCALESGFVVARMKLNGEVFSSPRAFGGRRVAVGCRDNNLYCLEVARKVR